MAFVHTFHSVLVLPMFLYTCYTLTHITARAFHLALKLCNEHGDHSVRDSEMPS